MDAGNTLPPSFPSHLRSSASSVAVPTAPSPSSSTGGTAATLKTSRGSSHADRHEQKDEGLKDVVRVTNKVFAGIDADGNKVVNQYVLLKEIGSGSFGSVRLCIDTQTNEFCAIKIFKKNLLQRKRLASGSALDVSIER